jgi:hypothetical protein
MALGPTVFVALAPCRANAAPCRCSRQNVLERMRKRNVSLQVDSKGAAAHADRRARLRIGRHGSELLAQSCGVSHVLYSDAPVGVRQPRVTGQLSG